MQLLMRVFGRKDRYRGLVDRGPAHPRVQITCREGRGGHAADSTAELRSVHELTRDALVLRHEPAGEVEGPAGDVGVDVDAAGKYERTGRVDCAAAIDLCDDPPLGDADVLDYAVDPIGRIVNLSARYPDHRRSAHGVRPEFAVSLTSFT